MFDPQRGEAVLKTTDAADEINTSVGRTETLPTEHSHYSSQLMGAWCLTANRRSDS